MRVFDENKKTQLTDYDLSKGYLKEDRLLIAHHKKIKAVKEVGHYETIAEYPNGGKDVKWVIDKKGAEEIPAWDEYENIQVYVPYTEKELAAIEIRELKNKLDATDYKAIKYAEGILSEEEYAEAKAERQAWRERINELEKISYG